MRAHSSNVPPSPPPSLLIAQNQRHILINSNNKREDRLARVKQRDYKTKLTTAEVCDGIM